MKIAMVIPWFGKDLKGGAEQHAWQIASRLTRRGEDVTVLTTCSKEFLSDWAENFYQEGNYNEEGIKIKRFRVKSRQQKSFDIINAKLLGLPKKQLVPGVSPLTEEEEKIYLEENIYSEGLHSYITKNKSNYDLFIFLPYLFPNIIKGIDAIEQKAISIPCLHDECYAYLQNVQNNFYNAKRIVFLSDGEYDVANKIYGPVIIGKSNVLYAGVETKISSDIKYEKFIVYLGRRDTGKNTHILIESFDKFIEETNSDLKLILAGIGGLPIQPKSENIVDLGLVSDDKKEELLSNCLALINPSENESFSRVIFEAWYAQKPVIVHQNCLATYNALKESNMAGFFAKDVDTFINVFRQIEKLSVDEIKAMGELGFKYAHEVANWDKVIKQYIKEFENIISSQKIRVTKKKNKVIHQLLPNLSYGDAISNQARAIRDLLLDEGYDSKIIVRYSDPKVANECELFDAGKLKVSDGLIYHHSIGFEYTQFASMHKGPKVLIYHNITPKDFFEPYDDNFAKILQKGREELSLLAKYFPVSYSDSQFNVNELRLNGFKAPKVLPLIVSPEKWNFKPDIETIKKLRDGRKNILFTGRLSPNKKQTDIVKLMHYLKYIDSNIRLCLVGEGDIINPYVREVYELIRKYGLENDIIISGKVSDEELKSFFMNADLYVSMSEHEGFGVPLIEAMWFDIPILAYKSSAIPDTLGEAAFMITDKKDMLSIAILVKYLLTDEALRKNIINAQKKVRINYALQNVYEQYKDLINELGFS